MEIVISNTNMQALSKIFNTKRMGEDLSWKPDLDEYIRKNTVIVFDDVYSPDHPNEEPVVFIMSGRYYFDFGGKMSAGPLVKDIDVEDLAKLLTQQMDLFKYHNDPESLQGYDKYQDNQKNLMDKITK